MKKIAATTLLAACSLLGAGCSDSTVETTAAPAVATATPAPAPLTDEQRRAIALSADDNKAAEKKKRDDPAKTDAATAVAAPELSEAKAVDPTDSLVKPTPTP